ncbi:hypothetical protein [Streptomyces sp. NPDC020298]
MRRPKIARRPTGRGIIRGLVSITARPAEAEDRKVPGHGEGDLVMGTRPSAVASLVERISRYTAIVALPDGIKAEQVTPHLTRRLLGIPPHLRRTLTWDRGREIAEQPSPPRPGCRSTSASRGARGNAAPTRTPTGCFGSTSPRAPTSARSAKPTWTPSLTHSTTVNWPCGRATPRGAYSCQAGCAAGAGAVAL